MPHSHSRKHNEGEKKKIGRIHGVDGLKNWTKGAKEIFYNTEVR